MPTLHGCGIYRLIYAFDLFTLDHELYFTTLICGCHFVADGWLYVVFWLFVGYLWTAIPGSRLLVTALPLRTRCGYIYVAVVRCRLFPTGVGC